MKDAIASASKSVVPSDDFSSKLEAGSGRRAHSSPGGTPQTTRGSHVQDSDPSSKPTTSGKKRRLAGIADESEHAEDKQEKKHTVAIECRATRGGRVANAAAAAAAVAAAGAGVGGGSPDILKPVGNDEREHLDPYIAKLQKRQRQQQRYGQSRGPQLFRSASFRWGCCDRVFCLCGFVPIFTTTALF